MSQHDDFAVNLSAAINHVMTKTAEAEIEKAVDAIRAKLRAQVAEMVMGLVEHSYTVGFDRSHNITITINLKEPSK